MKTYFLFVLALMISPWNLAQTPHALEPISDHYKQLGAISSHSNPQRSWMDTISYPPKEYGSSSIYLLVKPYYLSEKQVQALTASITPPGNSSDQTRTELDHLLALQNARTPEQVRRIEFLGDIGYWPSTDLVPSHPEYARNIKDLFFEGREILGNTCTADRYPRTAILLKGIMRDMRIMEFTIKYHYNRPRPYHLEPALKPLMRIGSPSFASGHTLWAFLQAYTWSELLPKRRNEFIRLADEIRRSREILGPHYPSDNEAARQISHKILTYYFTNKAFLKDFEVARVEWKEVHH